MRLSESHREILSLAIPSIITNVTVPILGLVNVAIVGHLGKAEYIAAIAVGGNIFNMLYWLLNFLRSGSSGMTAQAFGANDTKGRTLILYRSLIIATLLGICLILFRGHLSEIMLDILNVDSNLSVLAHRYFDTCIFGAPAVLSTFAISGWLLGSQNSRRPMWIYIFINVVNILVSLMLVFGFKLSLEGIAIGAIVAQWFGVVLAIFLCRKDFKLSKVTTKEIFKWREFKRFFSVNMDIFLRTLCLVTVTMWFVRSGASQGTVVLAVNTILMQLYLTYTYAMDGFAFAGEALTGKYIGAQNPKKLRRTIRDNFIWNLGLVFVFALVYSILGSKFVGILTNDIGVITEAEKYVDWTVAMLLTGFVAFTWDGIYIGATQTRSMFITTFLSMLTFIILYLLLFDKMRNDGLWLAFVANLTVRSLVQTILSKWVIYDKNPIRLK